MLINPTGDLGKFTQNGRFQEITVNYQTSKIKKEKEKILRVSRQKDFQGQEN